MAEITGKDLIVKWATAAGGTIDLSGDYRTLSYKPSIGMANATAGSDAFESYIATVKDTQVSLTAVYQSAGTATEDALLEGTFGTLTIQPEGTATGKRKYTIPAFALGANFDWKYNDTVELKVEFQGSGTRTIGVN